MAPYPNRCVVALLQTVNPARASSSLFRNLRLRHLGVSLPFHPDFSRVGIRLSHSGLQTPTQYRCPHLECAGRTTSRMDTWWLTRRLRSPDDHTLRPKGEIRCHPASRT